MGLNAGQKKAVEYLDGPLLVLAGPGTGKTQLLSEKVAYILKNTDTNPDNILCLTFTDTGAQNMRERLKTIIGKDALRVTIGTYHSFGQEILAQYKNYSPDYERQLNSAIDEVTQYKIIKNIQDNLGAKDILRGDSVKDIISVISDAKGANLSFDDLRLIAEQNVADSEILSGAISPLLKNVVPRQFRASFDNAYAPIFELLKTHTDDEPIIHGVERIIAGLSRALKDAISDALSQDSVKPLTTWRDAYFEKDKNGDYRLKDHVANRKLASIANVMEKYEKYLRENGLFDFDDMIEEAVRNLKEDAGFKATLQEKYQFILLDEFQDTNPSQLSIVKELTDYEKPMIMAVGDDDQAIYEFQGAHASNLSDFQEYYGAEVVTLTENYRSTQEILDFSREIINQAPDRFADKILTAHKESPAESQIHRIEFASSDAEFGFVANKISELIDSGVKQNEIAIISYKTKYFEPLLPYLKAHDNIKIAYEKRDNLFENERIHEILTIARLVWEIAAEKKSTVQIMEVLSYDFLHLPLIEVIKLVSDAKQSHSSVFEYLAEKGSDSIKSVMEILTGLVAKSFTEPLNNILFEIAHLIDLEKMSEYERFEFYENLSALDGKVRKHFGDKALKLGDLIEMVDDYLAADVALNVSSPYRDADAAVQVLTAHKSKGLEFEYVFILSADHTAWGKGKGNNNLLSLPKNLMQIRHTGTTDSEKLRILYVALTRAKRGLYITNSLADFMGKSPDRLEYFEEYTDKDGSGNMLVVSPFLPRKYVETMYALGSFETREENLKNWLASYLVNSPDMRAIYKERVANFRMSASALTSFIDVVYAGPQSFFKSYILQAPREPLTASLAYGDLIHKTFEYVTKCGADDAEAVEFFNREIEKIELSQEDLKDIRERGPSDLSVSLEKFGEILRSGEAEINLASEKIVIGGVPVTGKLDHITIDEENKTIEIYDFKTGNYHKERWQSHATLYKYMLQLIFYKMLLKNSTKYGKYTIKKAHILFVTPDRDGEVYDKEYIYNDADDEEFLKLLSAVYNKVESLEFLDDPEMFRAADSSLGLKDIKAFVSLMLDKTYEK